MNEPIGLHALIFDAVLRERQRQEDLKRAGKFLFTCADPELTDFARYAILGEEIGEVGRAILNWEGFSVDGRPPKLREELIQVMAVAMAWAEALDNPAKTG